MDSWRIKQGVVVTKYSVQKDIWPTHGRSILAQYTDDAVLVYQAYNRAIGEYAVANGKFKGAPGFTSRMTWIKPSFLWMMYRSDWGTAVNQEVVLGIWLKRQAFENILRSSLPSSHADVAAVARARTAGSLIRVQWDPDHDPSGAKQVRRAVQIGMKGIDSYEDGSDIVKIVDMSQFVSEQRANIGTDMLVTPVETLYPVSADLVSVLHMNDVDAHSHTDM